MSELKLRPPFAIQALALCGEPKSRSLAPLGMTDYKSRRDSSTSGRDVRPAKASGTQRTCFAHKATKASRPCSPIIVPAAAVGAGSMTAQRRESGVEFSPGTWARNPPPHSRKQQIPRYARDDTADDVRHTPKQEHRLKAMLQEARRDRGRRACGWDIRARRAARVRRASRGRGGPAAAGGTASAPASHARDRAHR